MAHIKKQGESYPALLFLRCFPSQKPLNHANLPIAIGGEHLIEEEFRNDFKILAVFRIFFSFKLLVTFAVFNLGAEDQIIRFQL